MSNSILVFSKIMEPKEIYEFGWYFPATQPVLLKVIPAFKSALIHVALTQPGSASQLVNPPPSLPSPQKLNTDGSFHLVTGVEIVTDHFAVRADSGPNGIAYAHLWHVTNTSPNQEVFVEGWLFYGF
jgi:hypothetical protein